MEHNKPLIILGSSSLVRGLLERGLVDEFGLMIHPLGLGEDRRLFEAKTPLTHFNLTKVITTDLRAVTYPPK